jgi:hypothetical protein
VYTAELQSRFVQPDVQVYSHGCFGFNRRDLNSYKNGLTPIDENTKVFGQKIYGIYILGEQTDFRRTQFRWFRDPVYGYYEHESPADHIQGSSFGIVVNIGGKAEIPGTNPVEIEQFQDPPIHNSYCFTLSTGKFEVEGKVVGDIKTGDKPKFCWREEDDKINNEFDQVFNMEGITASDFNWTECDAYSGGGGGSPVTAPPIKTPDFRIINPAQLYPKGSPGKLYKQRYVKGSSANLPFYSRPFPPGYYFPTESGYKPPYIGPPGGFGPDPDNTTESSEDEAIHLAVSADLTECEELPQLTGGCKYHKLHKKIIQIYQ